MGKTVSPADVLKEINQALHENRVESYAIPHDRQLVAQEFLLFENAGSDDLEKLVDSRFQTRAHDPQVPLPRRDPVRPLSRRAGSPVPQVLGGSADVKFTGLLMLGGRTIHAIMYSMASFLRLRLPVDHAR